MPSNHPNVGGRIRTIRQKKALSLKSLAERSGLSVNSLSLIERGQNSPTVSSLHRIAEALSVAITEFFDEPQDNSTILVRADQRLRAEGSGMSMESLGIGLRFQQLEPFLVTVEPGDAFPSAPVDHPGQEFVYCIAGRVQYEVAGCLYVLNPGDSLLFEAEQLHRFRNLGTDPAQLLVVFQASEGTHLARRSHLTTHDHPADTATRSPR